MPAKRSPYDFYPTPKAAFDAFYAADWENWMLCDKILEPCAGDGNLIKYMREKGINKFIWANELDQSHQPQLEQSGASAFGYKDFLQMKGVEDVYDIIITNPPFSCAQEFIEKCLTEWKPKRTIMLLRLNFLGSQKRKEFWQKFPPSRIYVLSKRPSFTGNGTDSQEYAWFVWDNKIYEQQIVVI